MSPLSGNIGRLDDSPCNGSIFSHEMPYLLSVDWVVRSFVALLFQPGSNRCVGGVDCCFFGRIPSQQMFCAQKLPSSLKISRSCGASNFCRLPLCLSSLQPTISMTTILCRICQIDFYCHLAQLVNICGELLRSLILLEGIFPSVGHWESSMNSSVEWVTKCVKNRCVSTCDC